MPLPQCSFANPLIQVLLCASPCEIWVSEGTSHCIYVAESKTDLAKTQERGWEA